jgi:hypothetical protein
MAKPSFLFQGVRRNNDHETAIRSIFSISDLSQVILSVAYVRETGVLQLENLLKKHASITTIFAGIRNGTTSAQGLLSLRACGVKLFVVDTGSISPIFHPKVYFALSKKAGIVITGSANLTTYGLSFNIEASTVLTLDRSDTVDEYYLNDLLSGFSSLQNDFPGYVTEIRAKREIAQLLEEGRIEDERITTRLPSNRIKESSERDKLKRIQLFVKKPDFIRKTKPKKKIIKKAIADRFLPGALELVWTSKGLTERDLNIPTGKNTNATGSMLFKKGQLDEIDQRTYFRQDVFSGLTWRNDTRSILSHLERAEANFEIMVKGINYGVFRLKLTHNSRTNTEAYRQLNAMTQIHWGEVKSIVAQRDLLERELRLYRRVDDSQSFAIEID